MKSKQTLEIEINLLEAMMIAIVLLAAYYFQFVYQELPCPLCLLQRVGFLGIAFGLILNIRFGVKPIHYGISIISGIYTQFVSGRQILLHIAPGTGHYGMAIFNLHLYTWSFIAASGLMLTCLALMIFNEQLSIIKITHITLTKTLSTLLLSLFSIIVFANIVTTYMECGFSQCPENPDHYLHVKAPQQNESLTKLPVIQ